MKTILVINSGSSSLKFKVFEVADNTISNLLASGRVEEIGDKESKGKIKILPSKQEIKSNQFFSDHKQALSYILSTLAEHDIKEPMAVGHRVVHGGQKLQHEVVISADVISEIKSCIGLAPLHNPANIIGIEASIAMFKDTKQVAVFDTAFHKTMPEIARTYAIPYQYSQEGYQSYGFHGISHEYIARRLAELENKDITDTSLISCHLGNGASLCAIKNGKSVDTSMGYTPLEGIVMGTRSGDIDAGLILSLMKDKNLSIAEIDTILNKKSGLLGISGLDNDMRVLLENPENKQAVLAIEIYCYRLAKYISSYLVALQTNATIVFTAGVGENSAYIRQKTIQYLHHLRYIIDEAKNTSGTKDCKISTADSFDVYVISTNEEKAIAEKTLKIISP